MKWKITLASLMTILGLKAGELEMGAKVPEVSGTNHHGNEVQIAPAPEQEWLLVFFYPKALTGG
ncbi:MAG: hypothetical protein ACSHYF_14360 [Verrucomicrobiaceae bacterium]